MPKSYSRFQRGTSCYLCACCGRRTRATGIQSVDSDLCPDCYALAELYNSGLDGADLRPYADEIRARCDRIEEAGGVLDDDAEYLLRLIRLGMISYE